MEPEVWPAEWMRGVLELCVLAVVAEAGPAGTHGYAVAKRLDMHGLGRVKGGTLYPLLARLEKDGHVRSGWVAGDGGPGRKTFVVTDSGSTHLRARSEAWRTFVRRAADVVDLGTRRDAHTDRKGT